MPLQIHSIMGTINMYLHTSVDADNCSCCCSNYGLAYLMQVAQSS